MIKSLLEGKKVRDMILKESKTQYKVVWDNGNHASGEFDNIFDTYEEADNFGKDWELEMTAMEEIPEDEEGYSYEVIEVEVPTDDDEQEEEIEGNPLFDKSIAGDR